MTTLQMVCPVTKREISTDVDLPAPRSALAAYGDVVGYTFTLKKCPDCGGTHAWESPDDEHLHGALSMVWTVTKPPRSHHASR